MKMNLPPVQPRSRRAHEAAHWARTQDRFDEYNEALFRAFFERGEDIGETKVLLSLAENLGLDKTALENALENHEFLESVLADEREAEMLGLSGVPAFVADRKVATTGVQTLETLEKLIAHARNSDEN